MLIVCPSCAATYDVPDERLVPGRAVRCAGCGAGWTPRPSQAAVRVLMEEEPEPAILPEAADEPSPPDPHPVSLPVPPAGRQLSRAVAAGWVATVLIVGGAAWAGVTWRDSVMQAWPPTERLYAALGLHRH